MKRYASIFDSFIGNLQKHSLLRIHGRGLMGCGEEEGIVKFVDDTVIQHVGALHVGQAFSRSAFRMVVAFAVESGDLCLDVPGIREQVPEFRG